MRPSCWAELSIKVSSTAALEKPVAVQGFLYEKFFAPLASPNNASLLWALTWVAMLYAVAWLMYRKKWFVKF
mgnify:CR=1 FL=1